MDGLPAESAEVLRDLITQSETHRQEQIAHLHDLIIRGESTAEAVKVLGQIEETLAVMRGRQAYLRMIGSSR